MGRKGPVSRMRIESKDRVVIDEKGRRFADALRQVIREGRSSQSGMWDRTKDVLLVQKRDGRGKGFPFLEEQSTRLIAGTCTAARWEGCGPGMKSSWGKCNQTSD